jgi:hypothetical protein
MQEAYKRWRGGCWTHYISGEPQLRRVIFNRQSVWLHLRTSLICLCVCIPPCPLYAFLGFLHSFGFVALNTNESSSLYDIINIYLFLHSTSSFLYAFLLPLLIIERNKQDGRGSIGMLMEGQRPNENGGPHLFSQKRSPYYKFRLRGGSTAEPIVRVWFRSALCVHLGPLELWTCQDIIHMSSQLEKKKKRRKKKILCPVRIGTAIHLCSVHYIYTS